MKKSNILIAAGLCALLSGCHNGDAEFPDYEYQVIYFAKQSPVRTITLGDEEFVDNSDDNEHAFRIKAVLGGVNTNKKERWATVCIDGSLCDNLTFSDGRPVTPMPESYYTMTTDRLKIAKGEVLGDVRIQLTDAYFADPKSLDVNYVIPMRLVSASDSILSGKPKDGVVNPVRTQKDDWSVAPQDYVLYAVKYKNPYHGAWLSKGTDVIEHNGTTKTVDRKVALWEKATVREISTKGLTKSCYSFSEVVPTVDASGNPSEKKLVCDLILDIDTAGNVKVSTESAGCTASGSGTWTHKGEPKAWGDKDRDLLKLSYTYAIEYVKNEQTGEKAVYKQTTEESLVMQNRQNRLEEFTFIRK